MMAETFLCISFSTRECQALCVYGEVRNFCKGDSDSHIGVLAGARALEMKW